jgi:hypothetical protein
MSTWVAAEMAESQLCGGSLSLCDSNSRTTQPSSMG